MRQYRPDYNRFCIGDSKQRTKKVVFTGTREKQKSKIYIPFATECVSGKMPAGIFFILAIASKDKGESKLTKLYHV